MLKIPSTIAKLIGIKNFKTFNSIGRKIDTKKFKKGIKTQFYQRK